MILYQSDWKNYPSAILHTRTKNKSFLKIAALYRDMGIKNHTFMLALVNRSLENIDPFSPYLTTDQMAAITAECKINPWYFFREIAMAPGQAGSDPIRFEANRGNIAAFWLFFNHITIIWIQIRQTGKSFSLNTLANMLLNIRCRDTQINLLTKDDDLRTQNIKNLKEIDEELPYYLRQRTKRDTNNTEEISISSINNTFKTHVPQKSPKAALNLGRGLTSPIFFIDESPFQPNIEISLPAALAAGTAARNRARLNNEPHGTILTTTAGKKDDRDGKYIYKLLTTSAPWSEKFLDCENVEQLEKVIRKTGSGELRVNCTFNHIQLGKDDLWLKRAIEEAFAEGEAADRDFFNVWTSGTQTNPLSVAILEKIRKSQVLDNYIEIDKKEGYVTRWYIPENQIDSIMYNGQFVMGVDTSDASGGDDISLVLTDIRTGELIAAGNYNETNLISFAEWLCEWFVRFENFVAIIERKSSGVMILDYLILLLQAKGIDPFKRLFNRVVNDYDEEPEKWRQVNMPVGRRNSRIYTDFKKSFGFATSATGMASRSELFSTTLQTAAKTAGDKIKDKKTIDQITGLTTRNGRVDHQVGEHDDLVIGWLLCFWLLTLGKNLSYYGIDSKTILMEVAKPELMDRQTFYDYEEQIRIREDIEHCVEMIKKETDEYVIQRLEFKLKNLNRNLVLEEGEIFSVDDLINSVRQEKRNRKQAIANNGIYSNSFGVANYSGSYSTTSPNTRGYYRL